MLFVTLAPSMQVFTWGFNNCGQLGCGDLTSRYSPTKLNGLLGNVCTCMCNLHKFRKDKNNWGWGATSQYICIVFDNIFGGALAPCAPFPKPVICALS